MPEDTVTISRKRYNELVEAEDHLNHLFAEGVDNWDGFSYPDSDDGEDE